MKCISYAIENFGWIRLQKYFVILSRLFLYQYDNFIPLTINGVLV
jgi:hypothetical protein